MDPATLAAFRASGETDLDTFLRKRATQPKLADIPPARALDNVQGVTNAERGLPAAVPTGDAFKARIANGLTALSGIPSAVYGAAHSLGTSLGLVAPTPAPKKLTLDDQLDELQKKLNAQNSAATNPFVYRQAVGGR